jgi:four helix bundle protein
VSSKNEFEERTRRFALEVMRFVSGLPKDKVADILGRQLIRSATSIGANYREAQRGESRADFVHKVALAEKEASETCYWLELCQEGQVGVKETTTGLLAEAEQLLAILVAICKRAKETRNPS